MRHLIAPSLPRGELATITRWSIAGALVASTFGILHDQITYAISPEYFTQMKFAQFGSLQSQIPPRAFVALIGILATWWFGLIATWILARIAKSPNLRQRIPNAWLTIAISSITLASLGFIIGPSTLTTIPDWKDSALSLGVTNLTNFAKVAGIHLGSYTGATLATLFLSIKWTISQRRPASSP
jgi:hypothetical protein